MTEPTVLDAREVPKETRLQTIIEALSALKAGERLVLVAPHDPDELLRKLIDDFPLRYDFSPRERGPEAWRYEIGVRTDMNARTVFNYLAWDHDRLDEMLLEAVKRAGGGDWDGTRELLGDFEHGLFRHIEIEEEILFKAFEAKTGMVDAGPTAVMRREHIEIKETVGAMVKAGKDEDADALARAKAQLVNVLTDHNMKEEQILYPGMDQMLDEASREALVIRLLLG